MKMRTRLAMLALIGWPLSATAATRTSTPSATGGPFYPPPRQRYGDVDNDLVRVGDRLVQAGGEVVGLCGRVMDRNLNPVEAARVEIWQCDNNGRYLHQSDSRPSQRDEVFQGFGFDITDASGGFMFRTIKPVPYPGRTPHIHVKVIIAGKERLITQLFLPDHPRNARDWIYRRIPAEKREQVTMRFVATDHDPLARVDLII